MRDGVLEHPAGRRRRFGDGEVLLAFSHQLLVGCMTDGWLAEEVAVPGDDGLTAPGKLNGDGGIQIKD